MAMTCRLIDDCDMSTNLKELHCRQEIERQRQHN